MGIFGIGTVVVDHVVVLETYPKVDTKSAIKTHWRQIGGPVPVALSVAAFYGSPTHFMGRWGDDVTGREIQQGLAARGINVSPSSSAPGWATGFAHVWSEQTTGSRTIAYHRGNFPSMTKADVSLQESVLNKCQLLHLDGTMADAALEAAHRVRANGGLVVLDAGSKKPRMDELVPLVDLIIASELFCRSWFGESSVSIDRLVSLGPKAVVRTQAERGAEFSDGVVTVHRPALDIHPIDTNGAGDIFSGAFLHGMLNRWHPEKSLEFANFVAGHACTSQGNSTYPEAKQYFDAKLGL